MDVTDAQGLLPVDRLTRVYLGVTAIFAVVFGGMTGLVIAGIHAVAYLAITPLARWRPESGLLGFLRVSYPVALAPVLYAEIATLNRFFTESFFDGLVQSWDAKIFGGQPSIELSSALPWLPFSEVLHLAYFGYYGIVPIALIGVFCTKGFAALHRTAFVVATAFFACYLIFMVFPVAGPRYEFARIEGPISEGAFYGLVHTILESGSSKGAAFPSSHIAASLAAVLGAAREDARWFWLLIIPEIALALGTVYGRFHYAIDALAGFALAVLIWRFDRRLFGFFGPRQPVMGSRYPTE